LALIVVSIPRKELLRKPPPSLNTACTHPTLTEIRRKSILFGCYRRAETAKLVSTEVNLTDKQKISDPLISMPAITKEFT